MAGQVVSDDGSTRSGVRGGGLEHNGAGLGFTAWPGGSTGGAGSPFTSEGNTVFGITLGGARGGLCPQRVSMLVRGSP